MSDKIQILQLEPPTELAFTGPFTEIVTSNLKLINPSDKKVCFKVKTTAPRQYCVRPNSGLIPAKSDVTVQVMLQPFDYDPNERNKHKFMVQSLFAPEDVYDLESVWRDVDPSKLMDSKLKCVFQLLENEGQNDLDSTGTTAREAFPGGQRNIRSTPDTTKQSNVAMLLGGGAGPDYDVKRLQDECKKLQSEVSQLRNENSLMKEDGLRQRMKSTTSDTKSSPPGSRVVETSSGTLPKIPSILYYIIAIIIGLIIGKLVL